MLQSATSVLYGTNLLFYLGIDSFVDQSLYCYLVTSNSGIQICSYFTSRLLFFFFEGSHGSKRGTLIYYTPPLNPHEVHNSTYGVYLELCQTFPKESKVNEPDYIKFWIPTPAPFGESPTANSSSPPLSLRPLPPNASLVIC